MNIGVRFPAEKPPVIKAFGKKSRSRFVVYFFLGLFGLMVLLVYSAIPKPPKESQLIQNFYTNRVAFEQLRDLLQTDKHLRRVAYWGVETTRPFFLGYPSASNFPTDRFNRYLALLKQTGGIVASRSEGEHADPDVCIWAWGWAGDSKHMGVCWMDEVPTNQIATLDGFRGLSRYPNREVVFRHIDENWYLWADF